MDMKKLLSSCDDDAELVQEIIDVFLKDYPTQLASIREGIEKQISFMVEQSAHALKGSVSLFGDSEVVDTALNLELMARKGDFAQSKETYERLETQLQCLRAALVAINVEAVP